MCVCVCVSICPLEGKQQNKTTDWWADWFRMHYLLITTSSGYTRDSTWNQDIRSHTLTNTDTHCWIQSPSESKPESKLHHQLISFLCCFYVGDVFVLICCCTTPSLCSWMTSPQTDRVACASNVTGRSQLTATQAGSSSILEPSKELQIRHIFISISI